MSVESHQTSVNSSVVEFSNIIATLHNSEFSQSLTPGTSTYPSTPISTTMTSSINDLVPYFYGRDVNNERGQKDPAEFIETLLFTIDGQTYTSEATKQTATCVIFRSRLWDKASLWYQDLAADVQGNWQLLEAAFLARFALVPRKEMDQTWFLNLVLNLKQRGRSIVDYIRKRNQLNTKYPEKF